MPFTDKYVSSLAGGSGDGLTAGNPMTWVQMIAEIKGGAGGGKRYNVKADGTYTRSAYDDIGSSVSGTGTNPIYIRGYKTTPGDGYLGRATANGALILTNMPVIQYVGDVAFNTGKLMILESLSMQGASGGNLLNVESNTAIIAMAVTNTHSGQQSVCTLREACIGFESDFINPLTSGPNTRVLDCQGGGVRIDSCRIITACPTVTGINVERFTFIHGCLVKGPGTGTSPGINIGDASRGPMVRDCTIVGFLDSIRWGQNQDYTSFIMGNMITDNLGYAFNATTLAPAVIIGPNRTRDNALGLYSNAANFFDAGRILPLVTTDTGGPETDYVNAAGNDYNLIITSPGVNGNRPLYQDFGAYDHQDPTGGGGSAVFHPLRNFIIRPA